MIAKCTWEINGIAGHSTISDVLRPWPELRSEALQSATPSEDDDPGGDCMFGVNVSELGDAVKILTGFIAAGAGYSLALFVRVVTPFGNVDASLGEDFCNAQVYPVSHDAKITEAAAAARHILSKALGDS